MSTSDWQGEVLLAEHTEVPHRALRPEHSARALAISPRLASPLSDRQAIIRTARLLLEPGQVTELRALDAVTDEDQQPHTVSGFFDSPAKLADAVASVRVARGICFVLDPVNPTLLERAPNQLRPATLGSATQDTDILRRRWLPIDITPKRPAGGSATEAEVDAAMKVRNGINRYLRQHGWPTPVTALSGKGVHLLFRIDLPADDGGLVRRVLEALAKRFDNDQVQVDRTVFNPARVWRLYGTVACEGIPSPERPHRMSQILGVPQPLEVVPAKLLETLAAEVGTPRGQPKSDDGRPKADHGAVPRPGGDNGRPFVNSLPQILVPGGPVRVTDTARKLGELLGATGRHFRREQSLTVMRRDEKGAPTLEIVKPAKFISLVEDVCQPVMPTGKGDLCAPTTLGRSSAEAILHADALLDSLPPVKTITRCPILLERNGHLVEVAEYDRESGVYAGGKPAKPVSLQEAKELLPALLYDFRFASDSDRSRALAALITPALVFGGLLPGRAPATLVEADKSQTGKGYLVKLIAAVYADTPATVVQHKNGVGGLEEKFDKAVLQGRSFISLDNLRGKFDNPSVESFLTEPEYFARVPYAEPVQVDTRETIVLATSNRAEFTEDFTNRVSAIRLLKQPAGYAFTRLPEGDLLAHVRSDQVWYLGMVFAVVRAWYAAGKPSSPATEHDFRAWCGALDWMVTNSLNAPPLMEGHREVQRRTVSPSLTWLRDVAHAVDAQQKLGEWLRPNGILEILRKSSDIEIPGLREADDIEDEAVRDRAFKGIGRRITECLGDEDEVAVDGYSVERRTTADENFRTRREYRFQASQPPKSPRSHPE